MTAWARWSAQPLRAAGPLGHALNATVFVPLFVIPATVGAALLFYGTSIDRRGSAPSRRV